MEQELKIPNHIAIILDGNGRWAKKKGLPRTVGHTNGAKALQRTIAACQKFGIKTLTVYGFSTENWSRPKEEVDFLMKLLLKHLTKQSKKLNGSRLILFDISLRILKENLFVTVAIIKL